MHTKRSMRTTILTTLLLLLLAVSLVFTQAMPGLQASAVGTQSADGDLQAGAGKGVIDFSKMFEEFGDEPVVKYFSGIADDPHARVLLLEADEKVAIVSLELVNCPDDGIELCKKIVSEITDTPVENVWVHATHVISTPHFESFSTYTVSERQTELCMAALEAAITEAAQQAADTFEPAVAGVGTGTLDINANRNLLIGDTYYYGLGGTYGESDKELSLLLVESAETGEPIGSLLNYGMKPDVINNTQEDEYARLVSSDAPGYACTYFEETYGGVALYLMGAAADQIPIETADYYEEDPETGEATRVELPLDEALDLVEKLGTQMAEAAIDIAGGIDCDGSDQVIAIDSDVLEYENASGDGTISVDVQVMQIGDLGLVGFKPEMNALTGLELKAASPFDTTMLISFMDGNQGYMPDAQAYEDNTLELANINRTPGTGLGQGAAEAFVELAVECLNGLLDSGDILSRFKDLEEDAWYLDHVRFAVENNLFTGVSDDEWAPEMEITRGMLVTVFGRLEAIDESDYPTCAFIDVDDDMYYAAYVEWASQENLVSGVGNDLFEPERSITREEIALLFMGYVEYKGVDTTVEDDSVFQAFPDKDATGEWAVPAMTWATANGIINGHADGYIRPGDGATRAQAAAIFQSVIEDIL